MSWYLWFHDDCCYHTFFKRLLPHCIAGILLPQCDACTVRQISCHCFWLARWALTYISAVSLIIALLMQSSLLSCQGNKSPAYISVAVGTKCFGILTVMHDEYIYQHRKSPIVPNIIFDTKTKKTLASIWLYFLIFKVYCKIMQQCYNLLNTHSV
jgi:hypothetical protein